MAFHAAGHRYGLDPRIATERPVITALLVLPPGFEARIAHGHPWTDALESAPAGQPGTVFWSAAGGICRAAILLAPDRPIAEHVLTELGLLSTLDALAVLAPPHVPLDVARPGTILVDGGSAGSIRSVQTPEQPPSWAILGFEIAVSPGHPSPGDNPDQTSLAEEGFGDVTPADLLQHICRHLLAWIDTWRGEGDAALSRELTGRFSYPHRSAAA